MKRLFGMAILLTALCSTLYAQSPDTPSFKLLGHQDALRLQKDSLAHRYAAPDSGRLVYTPKQLIVPGLLAAAGMATFFNKKEGLKNELVEYRTNHFSSFRTKVDNYMQFSPFIRMGPVGDFDGKNTDRCTYQYVTDIVFIVGHSEYPGPGCNAISGIGHPFVAIAILLA